ncbi:MAG TPA: hypothetical protein VGJ48_15740 [Pyrinomonadaceae bacterium]
MRKALTAFVMATAICSSITAQKETKPWKEWTRKEAEKTLNDSPWSQTQTETERAPEESTKSFGDTRGRESGITNVTAPSIIKFHVRFFSARPVRQSYVRMLELSDKPPDEATSQKLDAWANLRADDQIIVSVAYEGSNRASIAGLTRALTSAATDTLKNVVYLERKDGKRIYLTEYVPPSKDVFGARFKFPRTLDGQPFLTSDSAVIRFHAELQTKAPETSANATPSAAAAISGSHSAKFKIDVKFKVAEMIYNGDLEY